MLTLQVAIENSSDALAVIDSEGNVGYSNSAFQEFMEICSGKENNLLSFSPDSMEKGAGLLQRLKESLSNFEAGATWNTELVLADESARAFDLHLSSIRRDGEQEGATRDFVVWIRDITELKRREKFQREILSTTTHDLKGPLGAVITGGELLNDMLEEGKPYEIALRMTSAAKGVVNLIDEFLSAHRLQEGNFILKPQQHSIAELIEEPQTNFETIASARKVSLNFEVENADEKVCIDKLGFSRVLGNLLSNAIKFTPKEGSVTVTLKVNDEFQVSVSDTGAGMEPSELQRVFERFGRLKKHEHSVEGTGIGLFVVRCIVEAHAGAVQVTSSPGQGTTFELTFPLEPPVNERGELICLEFG